MLDKNDLSDTESLGPHAVLTRSPRSPRYLIPHLHPRYTSLSYAGQYADFQRNSQDDSPAKVKYADLNLRASVPACVYVAALVFA